MVSPGRGCCAARRKKPACGAVTRPRSNGIRVRINRPSASPGLRPLRRREPTLASFPEAFKQGMAARAERLGDIGPSAPENWEGVLGLDCVHGYFTGGYLVG